MEKILVSACLLGENCRYSGGNNYSESVVEFLKSREGLLEAVPVCPEVAGGLSTPRMPSEILGDRVVTKDGVDVTSAFNEGAKKTAALAESLGCCRAILKERSPSCGCGQIYDGTFTGRLIPGDGKTAALLKQQGIQIYGETGELI